MLGLGHQVVAAEPSLPMLRFLQVAAPKAHRLQGGAEAIGLSSSSVDAVIAAQAFHWFDPAKALPEIARVLRPGGSSRWCGTTATRPSRGCVGCRS